MIPYAAIIVILILLTAVFYHLDRSVAMGVGAFSLIIIGMMTVDAAVNGRDCLDISIFAVTENNHYNKNVSPTQQDLT